MYKELRKEKACGGDDEFVALLEEEVTKAKESKETAITDLSEIKKNIMDSVAKFETLEGELEKVLSTPIVNTTNEKEFLISSNPTGPRSAVRTTSQSKRRREEMEKEATEVFTDRDISDGTTDDAVIVSMLEEQEN